MYAVMTGSLILGTYIPGLFVFSDPLSVSSTWHVTDKRTLTWKENKEGFICVHHMHERYIHDKYGFIHEVPFRCVLEHWFRTNWLGVVSGGHFKYMLFHLFFFFIFVCDALCMDKKWIFVPAIDTSLRRRESLTFLSLLFLLFASAGDPTYI